MPKRTIVRITLFFVVLQILSAAVDCRLPRNQTERVVCSDPDLVKLDQQLSQVVEKALNASAAEPARRRIESEQSVWADSIGGCREHLDCIQKTYLNRIAVLNGYVVSVPPTEQGNPAQTPDDSQRTPTSEQPVGGSPAEQTGLQGSGTTPDQSAVPDRASPDSSAGLRVPLQSDRQAAQSKKDESGSATEEQATGRLQAAMWIFFGLIGLIPAFIGKSRGRSFLGWWIYGAIAFPIALVHLWFIKRSLSSSRPLDKAVAGFVPPTDEEGIRRNLRLFSHHGQAECIQCGYRGHMGLVKRTKPLHENGLFKLMAFMGGPVRNWYAASAFMGGVAKNILQCPKCGTILEQEAGGRPSLVLFGGR